MIIVFKKNVNSKELVRIKKLIENQGIEVNIAKGALNITFGLLGDTSNINIGQLEMNENIEKIMKIQEPFKKSNRSFHPQNTIINIEGQTIGGGNFAIIAGPCAIESENQFLSIAKAIKKGGGNFLRGGAFKPRTSPYSFQGLGEDGIKIMELAKKETGLPIITEMMSPKQVEKYSNRIDVIQIGARNMQNFDLLKEVGMSKKPVLLKRGLCATYEEFLMAAEYIMSEGNNNVILCERGIRTFETWTRNTLDISSIPVIKRKSHLPIIIDPSHAGGINWLVEPLTKAAVIIGADGITIEVHNNPEKALSDGQQSLLPQAFVKLVKKIKFLREVMKKID